MNIKQWQRTTDDIPYYIVNKDHIIVELKDWLNDHQYNIQNSFDEQYKSLSKECFPEINDEFWNNFLYDISQTSVTYLVLKKRDNEVFKDYFSSNNYIIEFVVSYAFSEYIIHNVCKKLSSPSVFGYFDIIINRILSIFANSENMTLHVQVNNKYFFNALELYLKSGFILNDEYYYKDEHLYLVMKYTGNKNFDTIPNKITIVSNLWNKINNYSDIPKSYLNKIEKSYFENLNGYLKKLQNIKGGNINDKGVYYKKYMKYKIKYINMMCI